MTKQSDKPDSSVADVILGPNPIVGFRATDVVRETARAVGIALRQPRLTGIAAKDIANEWIKVLKDDSDLSPAQRDTRFADPEWMDNKAYRQWLQAYLAWVEGINHWVDEQSEISPFAQNRLKFLAGLINDAIAPSNFPWQPVAFRKMKETRGASARAGLRNFLKDLRENRGLPAQVDTSRFKRGDNVANTPGAVVARTEVFELIQYNATQEKAHAIPLLIVPPQINKYYVFDLSPEKSVVRGLLDAGFQVFVVSWRNPGPEHAHWGLSEYSAGIELAVSVACNITGQKKVNLFGACAGGITLASFAAARLAVGDTRINSMSLLVNVLDTGALGDSSLGLFASPRALKAAKRLSKRKGVLDGKEMATAFAWLRPNDLIWNYWVNNILLGNSPPAFDVLYWNGDSTRLPACLHAQFLDIYKNNALTKPGALRLQGVPVDLTKISCDNYIVAGTTDHITPWKACYRSTQLLGGDSTFVLSNSGHIQSILNPPGKKKAEFWAGGETVADADEWRAAAEHVDGSWWPHWHAWLGKRSGRKKAVGNSVGNDAYPAIEAAPGTYIHG
ncbi:alpha/beta fold hydrolase [Spongiibacter marinus]|uniref:alpha/beta fold hydrolase n=1 Tax=Spongiibacter marinus TaxID=354246 RepID=UPI000417D054|nr:alpha/beta fold hydrolase [Spongiibacter marinus]